MRLDAPNSLAEPPDAESAAAQAQATSLARRRRLQAIVEVSLIFCLFLVYAAWPAPDVNESHYLCRIKQAWDPDWLPGDFFLNTPDAHPVFTWTCGWPTRFLSLPAFAWTGRVLTWLALAWAWRRLSYSLVSRDWYAVLSAALFVVACEISAPAGEWVIGGFEAKGPAYVLVLLALERVARNWWKQAFLLLGAATAFHPLVGGWAMVAVGIAWLLAGRQRQSLRAIWPGVAGGCVLSLAGIVPALLLSWGADASVVEEAQQTYVFWRLPHHLDPAAWKSDHVIATGLLLVAWLLAIVPFWRFQCFRRLGGVVMGTVLIGLTGCAIALALRSHSEMAAALLRFYWFRLADVFIPLGFSLWMMTILARWRNTWVGQGLLLVCLAWCAVQIGLVMRERRGAPPRADKEMIAYLDWREICRVAKEDTPRDARFLTPRMAQTFHWYAERADVANWKDIPQDASSIVEWTQRIHDLHPSDEEGAIPLSERTTDDVRQLAETYQANYAITFLDPPLSLPRLYGNRTYALYAVKASPWPCIDGTNACSIISMTPVMTPTRQGRSWLLRLKPL